MQIKLERFECQYSPDQTNCLTSSCMYVLGNDVCVIAERLSVRLLILQCVFSVRRVWCHTSGMQFVMLRNGIKGVACAQTSVPFKNAIKHPVYKKLYTLM